MNIVVKIGGAAGIGGDELLDDLARVARRHPRLVLVHGGSDEATRLGAALGRPARFLESPSGQSSRRTDREDLEIFAMATAWVNRQLVEGLAARGVRAFGLSGLDGGCVRGERKPAVRSVEDGRVRIVRDQWTGRPQRLERGPLRALQGAGCVPVLAPLIAGAHGEMLNTDGDRLAARVAADLGASTLIILTNVPGLLADPSRDDSLIAHVAPQEIDSVGACARGRMRKKLLGAREALEGGVRRVVLADARRPWPVQAALAGVGTVLGERFEVGASA